MGVEQESLSSQLEFSSYLKITKNQAYIKRRGRKYVLYGSRFEFSGELSLAAGRTVLYLSHFFIKIESKNIFNSLNKKSE